MCNRMHWHLCARQRFCISCQSSINYGNTEYPACTIGWVARLCRSWLSPGKATRISHGWNPSGTIQLLLKQIKKKKKKPKKAKKNKTKTKNKKDYAWMSSTPSLISCAVLSHLKRGNKDALTWRIFIVILEKLFVLYHSIYVRNLCSLLSVVSIRYNCINEVKELFAQSADV